MEVMSGAVTDSSEVSDRPHLTVLRTPPVPRSSTTNLGPSDQLSSRVMSLSPAASPAATVLSSRAILGVVCTSTLLPVSPGDRGTIFNTLTLSEKV